MRQKSQLRDNKDSFYRSMGVILFFVAVLFIWIPCGVCAGNVAKDKGHRFGDWAWAGFLLGPIGLLGAGGLSDNKLRRMIGLIAIDNGIAREAVRACALNPDDWAKHLGEVTASEKKRPDQGNTG